MTHLGKYEILEEIGKGGFGIVYKARDTSLDRLVALKILHPQLTVDSRFVENFKREARSLAKIAHPNVVTVHEIGELEGRLFITMRYLPGGSLADRLKKEGSLPLDEALKIIQEVSAGLEAGHKRNIIHRDVKPGNILFDEEGQAVIADFGVARAVQLSSLGTSTQSSATVGTPFYRPPELWRGSPPPSPATDVYSLACVLFEMLSGEILFQGDTPDQLITKHLLDDPQTLMKASWNKLPKSIQAVIAKSLSKDPLQRYQDISSFMQAQLENKGKQEVITPPIQARSADKPGDQLSTGSTNKRTTERSLWKPSDKKPQPESAQVPKTSKDIPKWVWPVGGALILTVIVLLGVLLSNRDGNQPMPVSYTHLTLPTN